MVMFDDLMWKLFPAGGDIVASVTQLVLWVGALFFLAGAILVGAINFASRRFARPAAIPVRDDFADPYDRRRVQ